MTRKKNYELRELPDGIVDATEELRFQALSSQVCYYFDQHYTSEIVW